MRRYVLLALMVMAVPALAGAQGAGSPGGRPAGATPHERGPEVSGTGGLSQLWDDEGSLGGGTLFGGGVGYRLADRLGVEFQVVRRRHERNFDSGVVFEADSTTLAGRLLYYFGQEGTRPYVAGGLGVFHYTRTSQFVIFQPGPTGAPVPVGSERFERSGDELMWATAFGVRLQPGARFFVRPEVGVQVSSPSNFVAITYAAAAGMSW